MGGGRGGGGGGGGGAWCGVVRATVWSELSAVGQLSARLSSLRSVPHTIYLAVKRPAALALPRPPSWTPPPPSFVFCISLVTVQALLLRLCILPGLLFCRHKISTTGYFAERVQHAGVEV